MTRRGFGILLLALGTYLAGRLLGTNELYLLALTFAGFVILSQVLVTITGAGLSVRREIVPSPPSAREPVAVSVEVENRSLAPTSPGRILVDLDDAADVDVRLELEALAPRERVVHEIEVPALRRGIYALPAPRLETIDPLGLARRRRRAGEEAALSVYPWIADLETCVFFSGRGRGQDPRTRAALAHASFDLRGVRPHQPGEPLSRIDWKSTAKTATLMLRETEEHTRSAVVLVLDGTETAQVGPSGDDTFELGVSVLGSIGTYLLREGLAVRLLLHGTHPEEDSLEPGDRGIRRLLAALAQAKPSGDQAVSSSMRAFRTTLAGGISVVLATPALDRSLLLALTTLADHGTPAYLLHIDTAGFREEHEFVATEKRKILLELESRGVPSLTILPEHDLGSVLSAVDARFPSRATERAASA